MEKEVNPNNQAELRMCFDYVSQIRDTDMRTRQHNVTLLVIVLGGISWLLFSSSSMNIVIQSLIAIALIIVVAIILYTNMALGSTDQQCQTLQAMILNGKITSRQEFVKAFDMALPANRIKVTNWMEQATKRIETDRRTKN
jgi:energy-converting hydrogenase Eha subunit C